MGTKQEVATVKERSVITFDPAAMAGVLASALSAGETLDVFSLPTVKVPTAGGQYWAVPDGPPAALLEGVIVYRQPVRSYWEQGFEESGGGSPPSCSSLDNVTGVGSPGGDCASCPLNVFGSGKDNGKACRQITRLFLLTTGNVMPWLVPLPPSAYKACQQYVVGLASKGLSAWGVTTMIALRSERSSGGITYSVPVFSAGKPLGAADKTAIEQYRAGLVPILTAMPLADEAV